MDSFIEDDKDELFGNSSSRKSAASYTSLVQLSQPSSVRRYLYISYTLHCLTIIAVVVALALTLRTPTTDDGKDLPRLAMASARTLTNATKEIYTVKGNVKKQKFKVDEKLRLQKRAMDEFKSQLKNQTQQIEFLQNSLLEMTSALAALNKTVNYKPQSKYAKFINITTTWQANNSVCSASLHRVVTLK